MADLDGREDAPLLRGPSPRPYQTTAPANGKSHDSRSSSPSLGRISEEEGEVVLSRSVEDDVLPETSTLGRTLSWQSAYILVISRVIGSGIFATPGAVLRAVGSPGLALTLWVVGGLTAACGLAVSLELGCMLPRSGGDKVYLEFAYRRPRFLASTLVVFHVVLLGFTASNCIVFSEYVLFAAGAENPSDGLRKGLAVALLSAVTIVHGCFRRAGVAVQNALGWLKVGLVIFMILSGLYAVVAFGPEPGGGEPGLPSLIHDPWQGSVWNWGVIATALFKVFYSFAGLENANNVLNEVRDPVRTLRSVSLTAPRDLGPHVPAHQPGLPLRRARRRDQVERRAGGRPVPGARLRPPPRRPHPAPGHRPVRRRKRHGRGLCHGKAATSPTLPRGGGVLRLICAYM